MSSSTTKRIPPGQRYTNCWAIYATLGVPKIDVQTWRLVFTGLVENPLSFTYDELVSILPTVKIQRDFHCVTGWSVQDVVWEGVPIKTLAEMVRVKPEVGWAMFHSAEGYTTIAPVEDVLAEDSIVALKMNGSPLTVEHGFPARPVIPHLYGWKSAKWLVEIEFRESYADGYWEMYGYHERGNVWEEERFKGRWGKHAPRKGLVTDRL